MGLVGQITSLVILRDYTKKADHAIFHDYNGKSTWLPVTGEYSGMAMIIENNGGTNIKIGNLNKNESLRNELVQEVEFKIAELQAKIDHEFANNCEGAIKNGVRN